MAGGALSGARSVTPGPAREGLGLAALSGELSRQQPHELAAGVAVELRDVWFGYRRREPVLRGISLAVYDSQVTMVLGASGSGKTTLLKLIKGLVAPGQGEIRVLGTPLPVQRTHATLDPKVAYIPQQLGLVRSSTVLVNTLTGTLGRLPRWRGAAGIFPGATVERAREMLHALGIGNKAGQKVRQLSGGERQRVAIARALMQQPSIILADEFVSQLDPATTAEIMELMRDIAGTGVALLITTHELDVVARFADRVVLVGGGHKLVDCSVDEVPVGELASLMK